MTGLGGDELVALHQLLGAIDAGDRGGAAAQLVTLLLALGRERAAEIVRAHADDHRGRPARRDS